MRRWVLLEVLLATLAALPAFANPAAQDATPPSAPEILDCGFRTRFNLEFMQVLDVETRRFERPVRNFRLQIATKQLDGRMHSLVVFLAPEDERGTKLLTIENPERTDDHFLYLPFLGRVKRIYGGRRQEPFLGTDFTLEDMERLHASDFDATLVRVERIEGHDYHVVSARPLGESGYARSEYVVGRRDCQIIEIRHFKRDSQLPFKIVSTPRSRMRPVRGVLMPTWAVARDVESKRETQMRFSEIRVGHDLAARYFEPSILERLDGIPGLSRGASPTP
jgi:hypothetical protein